MQQKEREGIGSLAVKSAHIFFFFALVWLFAGAGRSAAASPAADAAYAEGATLAGAKRHAEAAEKFEVAVAADPGHVDAWYGLAKARRKSGRCDRAIVAYRRYAQLAPTLSEPYYGLGVCLKETGDKAGALEALKHYVSVEKRAEAKQWTEHANTLITELSAAAPVAAPLKPPANKTPPAGPVAAKPPGAPAASSAYVEAQALRDRGQIDDALAKFRQAIAADPKNMLPRAALGELLLKIRRDDEAIEVFRAALDQNPAYPLAWYELAFVLRAKGRAAEAVEAYQRYIKLKPTDPDPYYGLGRALENLGRHAEAKRAYQTYITMEKRPAEKRWVESASAQIKTLAPPR
jgi:tetratricopeptide (TPR) repeat protein